MTEAVRGRNLIKGIFRELAVLAVPVRGTIDKSSHIYRVQLIGDSTRNTTDGDFVTLVPPPPERGAISLSFELDQTLLKAQLIPRTEVPGHFVLPEEIAVAQNRASKRTASTDLGSTPLVGELRAPGLRVYGHIKDSNGRYIVLVTTNAPTQLQPGCEIELRVYSEDRQTLVSYGSVTHIREVGANGAEFVIDLSPTPHSKSNARPPRWPVRNPTQIEIAWPTETGLRRTLTLQQVALTGFCAESSDDDTHALPIGAICLLPSLNAKARLVWREGTVVGFDLRPNPPAALSRWLEQLEKWSTLGISSLPASRQRTQIMKIMLRSGYLRGRKAQVFGQAHLDLMVPTSPGTRAWLSRHSRSHSQRSPDIHISFLRLSDSSWMIQELGHTTRAADGAQTITRSMLEFFDREQASATLDTCLLAISDDTSRFNREYWGPKKSGQFALSTTCSIVDITPLHAADAVTQSIQLQVEACSLSRWRSDYSELAKQYDTRLLAGLGMKQDTFDAPQLKHQLVESHYVLQRRVYIVRKERTIVGVAVAFGLPTFANLSATANHLWLLTTDPRNARGILDSLRATSDTPNPLLGATEAVIIAQGNLDETRADGLSSRTFSLFVIPLLNIPQFLGGQ